MATTQATVKCFTVEVLNGDGSYLVTVEYNEGDPDLFSFSSAAKLQKFIKKYLVTDEVTEVEELQK